MLTSEAVTERKLSSLGVGIGLVVAGALFGFFAVVEKFAGIIGPLVFGLVAVGGSSRNAILSVIAFFVVGGIILSFVNVSEGQRLARAAEAEAAVEGETAAAAGAVEGECSTRSAMWRSSKDAVTSGSKLAHSPAL